MVLALLPGTDHEAIVATVLQDGAHILPVLGHGQGIEDFDGGNDGLQFTSIGFGAYTGAAAIRSVPGSPVLLAVRD